MNKAELLDTINGRRKRLGMSIRGLGRQAGVQHSNLSVLMNYGRPYVSDAKLADLCTVLGYKLIVKTPGVEYAIEETKQG